MKKIYTCPRIEAVQLTTVERIFSGSDLHADGDNLTGSVYNTNATGAGLVKGQNYDVWGDDWSK